MKKFLLPGLLTATFGLAVLPAALCAEAAPAPSPAAPTADVAFSRWSDIKDHTHEMRAEFFVGLQRLEARLDEQIRALVAKRATMKGITGTRAWDFAMKELESARSYLKSVGRELAKASRETWDQEKDKVGRAWVSAQDAHDKVKSSTTS